MERLLFMTIFDQTLTEVKTSIATMSLYGRALVLGNLRWSPVALESSASRATPHVLYNELAKLINIVS